MISYISGVVEEIEKDKVVIDNNGRLWNICFPVYIRADWNW